MKYVIAVLIVVIILGSLVAMAIESHPELDCHVRHTCEVFIGR
jgi:hypothetical protein